MKRLLTPLLVLAMITLACSITPAPTTETPVTTEPPVITEPPTVVTEPPVVPNLTCNELSLYLDPALASGYTCETIPESTFEMEMHPQHTKVTLTGYVLADKFFSPQILVFPVQAYSNLLPARVPTVVAELQNLVGGATPAGGGLPFLPTFNAAQVFNAQYLPLPFASGDGIRYLTLFAQYSAPVNNHDLFYTYQGLSSDGLYWISAILPVTHPSLPANADNPPGGVTWEEFSNNYTVYATNMTNQLNAQTADSYTPNLMALDALVGSIALP